MNPKTTLRGLILATLLITLPGAYAAPNKTAPANFFWFNVVIKSSFKIRTACIPCQHEAKNVFRLPQSSETA